MTPITIRGPRVILETATPDDSESLVRILADPSVSRWWGIYDAARVVNELLPSATTLIASVGAEPIGFVQFTEESDPDYRHASIDIAVRESSQGQGFGTEILETLAHHLFEERGHHRLTIDPRTDNEPAIACYAKVGFQPVGTMRLYERGNDGDWHDGLLMDLLRDEFEPAT